ncbi:MAG: hypothetical protein RBU27_12805 [Bacteroidota bacterium]|jgi:hypothetical protein|nr:hypothetical protein [Bacteroidota bacterium]
MNTGQMALTVAAFMLLGFVSLNFRSASFQNEEVLDTNEYTQKAVAIGRSLLEEIGQKVYDQKLAGGAKIVRLTDLSTCGPAWNEKYPEFPDVDDYHGSVFTSPPDGTTPITTPKCLWGTWGYRVDVRVQFVWPNNPEVETGTRTYAKRVSLRISNTFSQDTVTMSYIAAF